MSDNEEALEEEFEEEHVEVFRPKPRNYEITMRAPVPKEREVHYHYGLLGLNPAFVLIQEESGAMIFAAEWASVWCVKATTEATVVSIVKH